MIGVLISQDGHESDETTINVADLHDHVHRWPYEGGVEKPLLKDDPAMKAHETCALIQT